ncbi:MAG: hypothetical protein M9935_07250 [Kiritimatiellae bacterium]|nr:hypothetical protein [Kiritimatiellia bacterium]
MSWSSVRIGRWGTTTLTVTATQPHYTGSTQEYVHTVSASVGSGIGDPISGNNSQSTQTTTVGVPMLTLLALLILGAVFIWARWRMQRREAEA